MRDRNPPGKSVLDYQNHTGAKEVEGSEGRRSKCHSKGQPAGWVLGGSRDAFLDFFAVFGF